MIIDIILVLVLIYIIYNIYNNKNKPDEFNILSNNIIFDDDIILINNSSNQKEQFENNPQTNASANAPANSSANAPTNAPTNASANAPANSSANAPTNAPPKASAKNIFNGNKKINENINKNVNEIFDLPDNTLEKQIEQNKITNDNKKNIELLFLPNNESRLNNRYNRKYNNIPSEQELYNINKYNLKQKIDLSNEDDIKSNMINNLKIVYSKNNKNIDTKIFNKNNKSQKLFKDAKTIAGRFTKNSIIEDYKYELDYYEKLRTPWWTENID